MTIKTLTPAERDLCLHIVGLGDSEEMWKENARVFSQPMMAGALIEYAKQTPYLHLPGYMNRHWLLNPYPTWEEKQAAKVPLPQWDLPSARIHHILREDHDRHHHDHPWDARTIVLRGWYREIRLMPDGSEQEFLRRPGDTATLNFGEFHRIIEVSEGGVWTLFITWKYQGTWGFLVDGKKVPYKTYLDL